jgi:hypothetical protein
VIVDGQPAIDELGRGIIAAHEADAWRAFLDECKRDRLVELIKFGRVIARQMPKGETPS